MKEDTLFKDILSHDFPKLESNENIKQRLNYAFLLKNTSYQVRKNSFLDILAWLFSFKSLGLKAGLFSILFISSIFINRIDSNRYMGIQADSVFIENNIKDSLVQKINTKDTIKLN